MRQQRIVIVGGGIVGLSTAYALLTAGVKQVTVLEQEVVNHHRASSHGISRLLRFEYGPDLFYSNMVRLSLSRWQQLEHLSRRRLYTRTGLLILGSEHDSFTRSSYRIMHELHMSSERLSKQHCEQRFPQFASHSHDFITCTPAPVPNSWLSASSWQQASGYTACWQICVYQCALPVNIFCISRAYLSHLLVFMPFLPS